MKGVNLSDGTNMPILGLGTWKSKAGQVEAAVKAAIDCGYRHIDCAYIYGNEAEVGSAIKEKITDGTVNREDLFIVSKLWNTRHEPKDVIPSLKESLQLLGLDYLDLYLVHWPMAFKSGEDKFPKDAEGQVLYGDVDLVENWKAMETCVDAGLTKSIGISNYNSQQTQRLLDAARIKPTVNQVEIHPYFSQEKLVKFCQEHGVAVTAYSPLGSADRPWAQPGEPLLVEDRKIKAIAAKYNKTAAQVFDFELSAEDMQAVADFNKDERIVVPKITVDGKQVMRDLAAPNFPFAIPF